MSRPDLHRLCAFLLVGALSNVSMADEVADVIKAKSGYVVSDKVEQVIARLPAPKIQAQGPCNPSSLGFENGAEWASGWNKAGYTNYLLMWGIYHFGDRVGSRKPPFCQDLQFTGQAWQSALGAKPSGKLSEADLQAFIRLAEGGDTRLTITRERANNPVVENGRVVPPEEVLARNREASDLDYGRIRWKLCALNLTAYVTIARCTLDIPDKELAPAGRVPAPDTRRSVKADLAAIKLGSRTADLVRQLPPALCNTNDQQKMTCRGRPSEDDYCKEPLEAINKVREMVSAYEKVPDGIRLSDSFLERFQTGTGSLRRLLPALEACKSQYRISAERASDVVFRGLALEKADLIFENGALQQIDLRPVNEGDLISTIKRVYGEPTSVKRSQYIEENRFGIVQYASPEFISSMRWESGSTSIYIRNGWTSLCLKMCQ